MLWWATLSPDTLRWSQLSQPSDSSVGLSIPKYVKFWSYELAGQPCDNGIKNNLVLFRCPASTIYIYYYIYIYIYIRALTMLMKWQYRSMAIESRAADNRSWMHDQAQNSDWWLQPRAMMKKSIGNLPFSGWDSWSRSRGVGKNMHIVNKGNLNCGDVQYGSMDVFWG